MRKLIFSLLCLSFLINIVSAADCKIINYYTDPQYPVYSWYQDGGAIHGYGYKVEYTAHVQFANIPPGGYIYHTNYANDFSDKTYADEQGYISFKAYNEIEERYPSSCPPNYRFFVVDSNDKVVYTELITFKIYYPDDVPYGDHVPKEANVPEFPTIAAPIEAILGLIVIFGRKKND